MANYNISSLVEIIDKYQPRVLADLKDKYRLNEKEAIILKSGLKLGPERERDAATDWLYFDAAYQGLSITLQRVAPVINRLKDRLTQAKNFRFAGNIISAVTSVGLIAAIAVNSKNAVTLVTAVVNLCGVLCSLIAGRIEAPSHGGNGTLIQLYEELVNADVEAQQLLLAFGIINQRSVAAAGLADKIDRANKVTAVLLKGERLLWQ